MCVINPQLRCLPQSILSISCTRAPGILKIVDLLRASEEEMGQEAEDRWR